MKLWQKSDCEKIQILTKLKMWQNTNYDQTQKSNCDKTKRNRIVTKLKNSNCDKTWIMTYRFMTKDTLKCLLVITFWHLHNRQDVLCAGFCDSLDVCVYK